eukprot:GGOE01015028.1.p1 GENE.GGOE01015028.1~~GGOE01015028.1.p1  ORF type:complete len:832 (+),score=220.18 GGOE01015028.1:101-2497(+)
MAEVIPQDVEVAQPLLPILFGAVTSPILITLAAYLLGVFGIVKVSSAQGLNEIVAKLLLPCLLLHAMLTLDLSEVQWSIIIVLTVSKLVLMFFLWGIVAVFISRQRLAKQGLYTIFITMSNDIAVGLPIMQVLFPKYQNYIFLVKPPQMLLLNGIAFAFLEFAHVTEHLRVSGGVESINGRPGESAPPPSAPKGVLWQVLLEVSWRMAKNPSVNTVFLGLLVNALFGPQCVPQFILGFLQVAGDGFASCALATLGLSLVGKEKVFFGRGLTWPVVLATLKSVAAPFLTHAIAQIITKDRELLGFFFVYGAIPSSPPVFTFAAEYGVAPDTIAGSLVLTLFMSTLVMLAGTYRMQTPLDLLSQNIALVSGWIALLSVVMVLPMVLVLLTQPAPANSPERCLPWLMFSELCFSSLHLICVFQPFGCCLFSIQLLHEFFRFQASVWICCFAFGLLLMARQQSRQFSAWVPYFHGAAWVLPALLLWPASHSLGQATELLPCIMRPGTHAGFNILALSACLVVDVRCLMLAHASNRASRAAASADSETPLREHSASLRYWSTSLRAESLPFHMPMDDLLSFMFRMRVIVVCEIVNLAFQILGEMRIRFGRNHFLLPFLFGMLLEHGQPLLLFFVFCLQDHVVSHCRSLIKKWWTFCCGPSRQTGEYSSGLDLLKDDAIEGGTDDYPKVELDHLVLLLQRMEGLLRDVHEYHNCFLGTEMVDWLVASGEVESRPHAVAVGRQMVECHLINHVRLERDFEDRPIPYRPTDPLSSFRPSPGQTATGHTPLPVPPHESYADRRANNG